MRLDRAAAPAVFVPLADYVPAASLRGAADVSHPAIGGELPDSGPSQAELAGAAYADLLSRQNWHWFLTLTFRPEHEKASGGMHPEKADKIFRVLVSKINREIYGVRWYKRPDGGIVWARGQEFHKDGRIHFHALAAAPTDDLNNLTRRMRWVDWWWKEKIGIARIEQPQCQAHVNAYVSKYVTKDGEVDFSPNYGRYVPPALHFGDTAQPEPNQQHRAPAAVAKRTGGRVERAPETASRCLTLPVRPAFPQSCFSDESFFEPDLRA